jgi:4-hydroxy-tetrahydrodipicolinate synthase
MMHALAGVFAAAVTPLKSDFTPDLDAIPLLLDFLVNRGCHGVLLLGTTGEGPSLAPEERAQIFCSALQIRSVHPSCKLLAGTGTPSLTETISITRTAFDFGCDGVVILPPYYYRKASDEGLFCYFSEVIRRAVPADGCVLGYHFPATAGIGFSIDLLARLKEAFPAQFIGIKDSSHNLDFARLLGERFGQDFLVMTGIDSFLQLALENHAGGCITAPANLISSDLRKIWDGFQKGDDISDYQLHITRIRHVLEKYGPFPPTLKTLLAMCYGFPQWSVRPPLEDIPPEIAERILQDWSAVTQ